MTATRRAGRGFAAIMNLFDFIAGCRHRMSRTFTIPARGLTPAVSYVVCLECGAEFDYNLATMRRGKKIYRVAQRPDMVALERERELERAGVAAVRGEDEMALPLLLPLIGIAGPILPPIFSDVRFAIVALGVLIFLLVLLSPDGAAENGEGDSQP